MDLALVIDLETTGIDTATCEVVQCAALVVSMDDGWREFPLTNWFARAIGEIPREASDVHGITTDRVADCAPFGEVARDVHAHIVHCDPELIITFNGGAFDLPVLARYGINLRQVPHLDVFRVWQVARECKIPPPNSAAAPRANRYTGALGSAYAWLNGCEPYPGREHDAGEDCRMTAAVARALVDWAGLAQCLAWSSGPLPGYADYAGKIRVCDGALHFGAWGKHAGRPLAEVARVDRGYLLWLLRGDFHHSTKTVVAAALG